MREAPIKCIAFAYANAYLRRRDMEFDGFDWDRGNREKCQKHGVSIRQIEELFRGFVLVGPDVRHSAAEERFRAFEGTLSLGVCGASSG
jgi:hypothetical protein